MRGVVTISASYGARGDQVARSVAERLQLRFIDRAIPTSAAARQLGLPEEVAESLDQQTPSRWERMALRLAGVATPIGPDVLAADVPLTFSPEGFQAASRRELQQVADSTGAVILGRAGMVALHGRRDVLCVRLDGPVEARIAQVVALGVDEATARQGQRTVDNAREAYARVFFNARQDDQRLYHVILDSTALSVQACVDVVVRAAADRFKASAPSPAVPGK